MIRRESPYHLERLLIIKTSLSQRSLAAISIVYPTLLIYKALLQQITSGCTEMNNQC